MKIAIVGAAHSATVAPFDDTSWSIWGHSPGNILPRCDRWFELHTADIVRAELGGSYLPWLAGQKIPINMLADLRAEIPKHETYPLHDVTQRFGTWFLTSTTAYMLALAVLFGPDEIGLFGIEMSDSVEYRAQKPGCRFFVQAARMLGIKVTAPEGCEVMEPGFLYMQPDARDHLRKKAVIRRNELAERVQQYRLVHEQNLIQIFLMRGALEIKIPEADIRARLAKVQEDDALLERQALTLNGALEDQEHVLNNWC